MRNLSVSATRAEPVKLTMVRGVLTPSFLQPPTLSHPLAMAAMGRRLGP